MKRVAFEEAPFWLRHRHWHSAAIATDSKSLLMANDSSCDMTVVIREIASELAETCKHLVLDWAPGHCVVEGNEEADHRIERHNPINPGWTRASNYQKVTAAKPEDLAIVHKRLIHRRIAKRRRD